ncbi:hypothetical protein TNCV_4406181 [Trichonephila clavipes]|nr:hypothetical protein TNCV_4406181 [Trichonephila clavipes]
MAEKVMRFAFKEARLSQFNEMGWHVWVLIVNLNARELGISGLMKKHHIATPPGFHRPTNRRHVTQQKGKHLSPFPASKTCHDMGLRTVFTVQMPQKKGLFNAYSR